jgi:hypothetical protein
MLRRQRTLAGYALYIPLSAAGTRMLFWFIVWSYSSYRCVGCLATYHPVKRPGYYAKTCRGSLHRCLSYVFILLWLPAIAARFVEH